MEDNETSDLNLPTTLLPGVEITPEATAESSALETPRSAPAQAPTPAPAAAPAATPAPTPLNPMMAGASGLRVPDRQASADAADGAYLGLDSARYNLAEAMVGAINPDQFVTDLEKAKFAYLSYDTYKGMNQQERVAAIANVMNVSRMYRDTPVLARKFNDIEFAGVAADSIDELGMIETWWRRLMPRPGQKPTDGQWGATFANSVARGGYQLPALYNEAQAEALSRELAEMRATKARIDSGESIADIFGTEEEPTGKLGYEAFLGSYESREKDIQQRISAYAHDIASLQRRAAEYPHNEVMDQISDAKTFSDASSLVADSPVTAVLDAVPESLIRSAPELFATGAFGAAFGAIGTAANLGRLATLAAGSPEALRLTRVMSAIRAASIAPGAYAGSFANEYSARILDIAGDFGFNTMDGESLTRFFSDPDYADLFRMASGLAREQAAFPAFFDALAMGIGSMTLVPRALRATLGARGASALNVVNQAGVQAASGMAGEAGAQLAASGRVSNPGDVLIEGIAEVPGTPIDIAVASLKAGRATGIDRERAARFQQAFERIAEHARIAPIMQRDPQTTGEFVAEIVKENGIDKVYIDTEALRQDGGDALMEQAPPEIRAAYEQSLRDGSEMEISVQDFVQHLLPRDENNVLANSVHADGLPTFAEAQQLEQELTGKINQAFQDSIAKASGEFSASLTRVSQKLDGLLDHLVAKDAQGQPVERGSVPGGMMTRSQAETIKSYLASLVSVIAEDAGMLPETLWDTYGLTSVLGPQDVRYENGRPTLTSQYAIDSIAGAGPQSAAQSVNQNSQQGPKGAYLPDYRSILHMASADRSTFLHESSHWFLEVYTRVAMDLQSRDPGTLTEGQRFLLEKVNDVMDWMGTDLLKFSNMSFDQKRAMHERFARSYEAYIHEGSSAARPLRALFQRFSAWLKTVYKQLSNIPGAEINEQVEDMFDALLTSHNDIEAVRIRREARREFARNQSDFDNLDPATVTDVWDEYLRLQEQSAEEARIEIANAKMRDNRRLRRLRTMKTRGMTRELREGKDRIEREVWAEVEQTKAYKAYVLMSQGKETPDGKIYPKLTFSAVRALGLSRADIQFLRDHELIAQSSPLPSIATANALGYASVEELVRDLLAQGDPVAKAQAEIDARVMQEFGEITDPVKLREAAENAMFNEARLSALELAAREYARRAGRPARNRQIFKTVAKAEAGAVAVGDIDNRMRSARHAAQRSERRSNRAYNSGDMATAADQGNKAVLNAERVKSLKDAKELVKALVKKARKVGKKREIGSVDIAYLGAAQRLLRLVGLIDQEGPLTNNQTIVLSNANDATHTSLLDKAADDGFTIDVQAGLLDRIELGQLNIGDGTASVADTEAVLDLLNDILHVGREVRTVIVNNERVEISDLRKDIKDSIDAQAQKKGKKARINQEPTSAIGRAMSKIRGMAAVHMRIPSFLAAIEGTRFGKLFEAVVRPMQDCISKQQELQHQVTERLYAIMEPMLSDLRSGKTALYPELNNASLTKGQVFAMLLNMGNEGNKQRLLDGAEHSAVFGNRKITEAGVLAAIQRTLTTQEIEAAQEIWDLFDTLRGEIEAKEERKHGRIPKWVDPTAVVIQTAQGPLQLRGGYFPIVYDRAASARSARMDSLKTAQMLMSAAQNRASTFQGHLKSRAARVSRPLALSLRGVFEGFDNVIYDVSWDEWLLRTNRIFSDSVLNKIGQYYGPEARDQISKWLVSIARQGQVEQAEADVIANALRRNVAMVGVGLNLVTALIQPLAITQSVSVLGSGWTLKGVGRFLALGGPIGAARWVGAKSRIMNDRARTQFREVAELQNRVTSGQANIVDKFTRTAYWPIVASQMLVDVPTWLGAYEKAMHEGRTEEDAIAIADRTVLDTQGSGLVSEMASVEKGNPWQRLLTVYYTFFNTALNLAMVTGHIDSKFKAARNIMLIMIVQPVLETFVREAFKVGGNEDETDDEYWKRMMRQSTANVVSFGLGSVVGLREASSWAASKIDGSYVPYRGPTGLRKIPDLMKFFDSWSAVVSGDKEFDCKVAQHTVTAMGEIGLPIPVVPINRAISGGMAIKEGKTDNYMAILFGYTRK